ARWGVFLHPASVTAATSSPILIGFTAAPPLRSTAAAKRVALDSLRPPRLPRALPGIGRPRPTRGCGTRRDRPDSSAARIRRSPPHWAGRRPRGAQDAAVTPGLGERRQ